ncbi:hypothetical protein [Shewanella khirikhana]|uniref:Uncharacterized protein n=1 Tax=Shewanella khirikhana TaxID=1965282 RepID=A0ABM7DXE2_9GAMM|nr:hypothetical protein [Shewanella khirikhana]AZQ13271.1 hypothetical protein STH12_04245 [Shewanella khirikhana]
MKNIIVLSLMLGSCFMTAIAADTEKMTFEKAAQSHNATFGQYSEQSITEQQSQLAWDSYPQYPDQIQTGSNGQLQEVWTGRATTVTNQWGQGDYYVEMTFNKQNTAGSVWLTVDNTNLKKSVAVPSPYNYEANWHIMYERGVFRAEGLGKGSTTPSITRIAKFPTPQLNDCTAGQTESEPLYCTGSGQRTCEEGRRSRSCASNGGWLPWQTTRQPSCVTGTQQCR